jgi:hypothetical protein
MISFEMYPIFAEIKVRLRTVGLPDIFLWDGIHSPVFDGKIVFSSICAQNISHFQHVKSYFYGLDVHFFQLVNIRAYDADVARKSFAFVIREGNSAYRHNVVNTIQNFEIEY